MRRPLAQSLAALALLALAACGSDKDKSKLDKYKASPSAPAGATPPAPPPPAPPPPPAEPPPPKDEPAPAATASKVPPPTTGLPRMCNEYRDAIERLMQCGDALPKETQDALKEQFDNQWAGWHKLPDHDRIHLKGVCSRAAANVKLAAGKACGW
ncbi:MAG TPA: hypothetical protein VNO30_27265 [Kofleriaceae bacterium]|nr:hypothetical protein [Kofleriaceae bacterium]